MLAGVVGCGTLKAFLGVAVTGNGGMSDSTLSCFTATLVVLCLFEGDSSSSSSISVDADVESRCVFFLGVEVADFGVPDLPFDDLDCEDEMPNLAPATERILTNRSWIARAVGTSPLFDAVVGIVSTSGATSEIARGYE